MRHRIALAAILYRHRKGKGASISRLKGITGFARNTIKSHLKTLSERGYTYKNDGLFWANEPTTFALKIKYRWKKKDQSENWYDRLQTFRLSLPLPDLLTAYVLSKVLSHLRPKQTISGLAKMLWGLK